jgi:hypothetical protein
VARYCTTCGRDKALHRKVGGHRDCLLVERKRDPEKDADYPIYRADLTAYAKAERDRG